MSTQPEKARKPRTIVSDKIDRGSPAYRIIITHGGGLTPSSDLLGMSTNTVYGWLRRGQIPHGKRRDEIHAKFKAAGKGFPRRWFDERTDQVDAEAA